MGCEGGRGKNSGGVTSRYPPPGTHKTTADRSGLGNTALPIISVRRNVARIFLEDNYKFINLDDL